MYKQSRRIRLGLIVGGGVVGLIGIVSGSALIETAGVGLIFVSAMWSLFAEWPGE